MKQLSKNEVLTKIHQEHGALRKTLAALTDADLAEPGVLAEPAPGQSCQDILAHLTAWEQRMLALSQAILQGAPAPFYPPTSEFNQQVFQVNHHRALAEIRVEFEQSFAESCRFIQELSEEQLAVNGVWQLIGYNTYCHYRWANTLIRRWRRNKPIR